MRTIARHICIFLAELLYGVACMFQSAGWWLHRRYLPGYLDWQDSEPPETPRDNGTFRPIAPVLHFKSRSVIISEDFADPERTKDEPSDGAA